MKFIHIICLSLALSASSLSATVSAQTGTGYFAYRDKRTKPVLHCQHVSRFG